MDNLTTVLAFLSTILSSSVSLIYAYIAYKKSKEPPKDEIWETVTKILCSNSKGDKSADDFALLYESLELFKKNNCSKDGIPSLKLAVMGKNRHEEESQ